MWLVYFGVALVGYLLGSIPTGYLIGRMHGIDIRQHGSGNIGATNVVRVLGKKPGYFVFFCDALKGWLATLSAYLLLNHMVASESSQVFFFPSFGTNFGNLFGWLDQIIPTFGSGGFTNTYYTNLDTLLWHGSVLSIVAALACILGHNFPVWLKFRGGKGVATTIGVLLGLMPLALLIVLPVWLLTFFLSGYVSLASMLAGLSLPIAICGLQRFSPMGRGAFWPTFYFALVAAFLVVWRHRANIQRLLAGTEPRSGRKTKIPAASPEAAP